MKYEDAFKLLLTFEGKQFTEISGDAGGKTKFGISEKVYPGIDIENLTEEQAGLIYHTDYWNHCKCLNLPGALQYIVFDTAVNCGQGTAIMLLQKCAGIEQDGIIGQQTFDAAQRVTIEQYADARKARYADIIFKNPQDKKFQTGWFNRVEKIVQMELNGELS